VILIALAMSRPTLTASGAKWFGAQEEVGAVVAIDGSFSMSHKPGVSSRFDRATQAVRDLRPALNPGDPFSLLVAGNHPRVLLRGSGYNDARLEKVLKEAGPLPETLNLEATLDQIATLVRETKAPVRECYIVTDGQAVTWESLSDKARRNLQEISGLAHIFVMPITGDSGENLGVTDLVLTAGDLRRGTTARYTAEVRNFGKSPQERVTVTLMVGDKSAGEKTVDQRRIDRIEPGDTVAIPLFARFDEPGYARLTVGINADALQIDNSRRAVARVRDQIRILLVDGDPSDRPFRGETDYLATALVPKGLGAGKSGLAVDVVPWVELGSKSFNAYDIVMLANMPDIRQPQADDLAAFVREGGGMVFFLGDKVTPALLNERIGRGETALMPGEILDMAAADTPEGRPMAMADAGHPLARALSALPRPLLDDVRVNRFFKLTLGPQGRPVFRMAGSEAVLLAEKAVGRGKVLLFTSTADRSWTNLPVHPAFPILMHEVATYLTTQAHERSLVVGEPVVVPVAAKSDQATAVFHAPGGAELAVTVTDRDGRRVAEYDEATEPGFYEMSAGKDVPPVIVAVNVDARESDVRVLSADQLAKVLAGLPVRVLPPGDDAVSAIRESRVGRELWRILMILALATLAIEGYLALRFTRQMVSGGAGQDRGRGFPTTAERRAA